MATACRIPSAGGCGIAPPVGGRGVKRGNKEAGPPEKGPCVSPIHEGREAKLKKTVYGIW
jgi:hypothetical protein